MILTKHEAQAIILFLPQPTSNPNDHFNDALESLHEKAKEVLGGRWAHRIKILRPERVK